MFAMLSSGEESVRIEGMKLIWVSIVKNGPSQVVGFVDQLLQHVMNQVDASFFENVDASGNVFWQVRNRAPAELSC